MHLYLYGNTSLIQNIKQGQLILEKLSHPIIENTLIENIQTSKKRLSKKDFVKEMEIQYQKLPGNLKSMVTFEYFLEQSESKRSQIESALHNVKTSLDQILFDTSVFDQVAVLNLFESNNHFNLWRNQADQFKGICVSLNLESLRNGQFQNKKQLRKLQAINYTQDKEYIKQPDNPLPGVFDMPIELESEKGWRLVIPKHQCPVNQNKQAFLKLRRSDIDSITFGTHADHSLKEQTMRYFQTDINLKHVTFNQLHTSNRHFEFSVRPIR